MDNGPVVMGRGRLIRSIVRLAAVAGLVVVGIVVGTPQYETWLRSRVTSEVRRQYQRECVFVVQPSFVTAWYGYRLEGYKHSRRLGA